MVVFEVAVVFGVEEIVLKVVDITGSKNILRFVNVNRIDDYNLTCLEMKLIPSLFR